MDESKALLRSSFDIRCSMFGVRCSVFDVRYSVFDIRCSIFGVRCSMFGVRYSVFDIRCSGVLTDQSRDALTTITLCVYEVTRQTRS